MTEPTSSLRAVITGGDMTFSGNDDDNPLALVSMTEPALVQRRTYADDSAHVEGSLQTQSVPGQSNLNATVGLKGTTQTSLEAQKASLRAALNQRRIWVAEVNGYELAWSGDSGDMAPVEAPDDYPNLRDFQAFYALTIPVRPTPEVV